jgi:hypothetical protein
VEIQTTEIPVENNEMKSQLNHSDRDWIKSIQRRTTRRTTATTTTTTTTTLPTTTQQPVQTRRFRPRQQQLAPQAASYSK